eukprot:TRINITY_DN4085_c0_g1_i1.p1 TRINITY_DN4085_c0_g1~~TRINITY_DN4085_c0_g1_i1.p1  ORF type:complete len:623 (+),score=77.82 TRINITY_DN4085_c0_g1_i1:69-1937(+)
MASCLLRCVLAFQQVLAILASLEAPAESSLLPKWPKATSPPEDPDSASRMKSPGPIVSTENGPVRGVYRGLSRRSVAWWGIPFAEPPVGALRLRAPQALNRNWSTPLEASHIPKSCQAVEDCLYLNVYAPSKVSNTSGLPVMVWIYGGGFVVGDNYELGLYDGQHLCEQHGVVLVAMNYRLGNLGFMALEALKQEDPDSSTGNYGVQDQNLALKWVQRNIANFGGDPGQVTLFGESAGGMSVMWHLVSPSSKGLFHAAIMESGTSALSYFFQRFEDASSYHEETAEILKCPAALGAAAQLKCLRDLPMESILHGAGSELLRGAEVTPRPKDHSPLYPVMPVGPVIDGTSVGLMDVPIKLVEGGHFNKVPLITGANENGGTIFEPYIGRLVPGARWPASVFHESLQRAVDYMFSSNASIVNHTYSLDEYRSALGPEDLLLSRLIRDLVFLCPARSLASAWTKHGVPAFMYVFEFRYGLLVDRGLHLGDFHAGELPFVFKNWIWAVRAAGPLTSPARMSDIMSCKWTSFAYAHDPNGGPDESRWPPHCKAVNQRYSDWPRYSLVDRKFYSLKDRPEVRPILPDNRFPDDLFPRDEKCDLWDDMAPYLRFAHTSDNDAGASLLLV